MVTLARKGLLPWLTTIRTAGRIQDIPKHHTDDYELDQ